jgi:type III restriction enzyme
LITLDPFQIEASDKIASRYNDFASDPKRPFEEKDFPTPFYQALSAITGAGKTPILADAVQQVRASMTVEPLVLWLTKSKVVIDQTFINFSSGGKYSHLLEDFLVIRLSSLRSEMIMDSSRPILAVATVGTFNQKDKENGTLLIYKIDTDTSSRSLWNNIKERKTTRGICRPLIIVYDEGHNLSDQQVELLLELEPEAIFTASATLKTPGRLGEIIERLKTKGWGDRLVTGVLSLDVVNAELIKKQVILGGYQTTMEAAIDSMLDEMNITTDIAQKRSLPINPKAIYVSRTNISEDTGKKDDATLPFKQRNAPPILIWRYLTEVKKIHPNEIAVYCDLTVSRKFPLPKAFRLFKNGENDFDDFSSGKFKHIIFNQSLQEGWDDPECYFAYIDKSMGSDTQIEQVIGRLFRQPGIKYYEDESLNTASFFIRYDENTVFPEILQQVSKKLSAESPEIKIKSYTSPHSKPVRYEPKTLENTVPYIYINLEDAEPYLDRIMEEAIDYTDDVRNTTGGGKIERVLQTIGTGDGVIHLDPIILTNSNRIRARRIISHEIQRLYPLAEALFHQSHIPKFDAKVEITSRAAASLRRVAEDFVDAYLQYSFLEYDEKGEFTIGPALVSPDAIPFVNAVHEQYSNLNQDEIDCAQAIDSLGVTWMRNPSNGGYFIPLLEKGKGSKKFYPDFLVWRDELVFALDPKAKHLTNVALATKLLDIKSVDGTPKVVIRFISEGKWDKNIKQLDKVGHTVWSLRHGLPHPTFCITIKEAVEEAIKLS